MQHLEGATETYAVNSSPADNGRTAPAAGAMCPRMDAHTSTSVEDTPARVGHASVVDELSVITANNLSVYNRNDAERTVSATTVRCEDQKRGVSTRDEGDDSGGASERGGASWEGLRGKVESSAGRNSNIGMTGSQVKVRQSFGRSRNQLFHSLDTVGKISNSFKELTFYRSLAADQLCTDHVVSGHVVSDHSSSSSDSEYCNGYSWSNGPIYQETLQPADVPLREHHQDRHNQELAIVYQTLYEEKMRRERAEENLRLMTPAAAQGRVRQLEATVNSMAKKYDEVTMECVLLREQVLQYEKDFKEERWDRKRAAELKKRFERGCDVLQYERNAAIDKARQLEAENDRLVSEMFRLEELLRQQQTTHSSERTPARRLPLTTETCMRPTTSAAATVMTSQNDAEAGLERRPDDVTTVNDRIAAGLTAFRASRGSPDAQVPGERMGAGSSDEEFEVVNRTDTWTCDVCSHVNAFNGKDYCSSCSTIDKERSLCLTTSVGGRMPTVR